MQISWIVTNYERVIKISENRGIHIVFRFFCVDLSLQTPPEKIILIIQLMMIGESEGKFA